MGMSNPNPSGRKANFAPERESDESDTAGIVLHGRRSLFALYHRTARAIHPDFFPQSFITRVSNFGGDALTLMCFSFSEGTHGRGTRADQRV
jgi:hypothetical protein